MQVTFRVGLCRPTVTRAALLSLALAAAALGAPMIETAAAAPSAPAGVGTGVPEAPGVPAVLSGDSTAQVSWSVPYNGGSPITGYVVTPFLS
ncbi:MAG: hypothetical protein ACT4OV_01335, partial [Microthrixaceae bacterium]